VKPVLRSFAATHPWRKVRAKDGAPTSVQPMIVDLVGPVGVAELVCKHAGKILLCISVPVQI
jgi:hypothetical protein